eukprot:TRINITY_DN29607_c0_g1_i1.p1 TRINITY_DN29607_c0_g1~~TRINITY_DN29607_c0_g1_i1.p1  ORF type:complete len:406 (-),score=63.54 TRINITY_DN29607_c0_g1_i1:318-1367(-)
MKALKDELRIYDPRDRREWLNKYSFFSGKHVGENTYKNIVKSRRDPFNKGPSWGKRFLARVSKKCEKDGVELDALFDTAGRQDKLGREGARKIMLSVQPNLSDGELVHIYDAMRKEGTTTVSREDFRRALAAAREQPMPADDSATVPCSPVDHISRWPGQPSEKSRFLVEESELCHYALPVEDMEVREENIARILCSSRWGAQGKSRAPATPRHLYFAGGGEADRFRRAHHRAARQSAERSKRSAPLEWSAAAAASAAKPLLAGEREGLQRTASRSARATLRAEPEAEVDIGKLSSASPVRQKSVRGLPEVHGPAPKATTPARLSMLRNRVATVAPASKLFHSVGAFGG